MAPRMLAHRDALRDVVLCGRAETLSDAALVGVLVAECSEDAGRAVLDAHPIPDCFWRLNAEDLMRLPGVGPAGAARLLACLEMSRRASAWPAAARPTVSTAQDREHFWALALNTKNQLLRMVEISVGSLNASIVHPRELYKEAVRLSAASIVVVHNHPSGDPTPSGADLQLTRRLSRAGDVLGIELIDHVVVGDGGAFVSIREMGAM
jgi:DNA repair protein RadC